MPKTKVNENKSKDEQIRELKAELKKARKEAELEKLRAHAYDTIVLNLCYSIFFLSFLVFFNKFSYFCSRIV